MLERVAMHQTRLRVPGVGVDAKGVALGSRGLVLVASIERLVAFLSLFTSSQSLADILPSLRIEVVRSRMNTREVLLSFSAQGSERMDRVAEVARAAFGNTFTGTSAHFVQYRDAQAPFGYDVSEVLAADGDYVLYHNLFTQTYKRERDIDLRNLLLRLRPHQDPAFGKTPGPSWIIAEEGIGPAVIQYFIRSRVEARMGVVQWPPLSALDDGPVRRFLFDVPELPDRMAPLFRSTPGITTFRPVAPGAAVQVGWRHPVTLRACPVFGEDGLVLFRGHNSDPLVIDKVPALGAVSSFARVTISDQTSFTPAAPVRPDTLGQVAVPVRLMPSIEPWSSVHASYIPPSDLPVLRRVIYALGARTLREASIAFTHAGAFLLNRQGVESTPVGLFLREMRPNLFIAAGYDPVPAIDPEVMFRALGSPGDQVIFLLPNQPAVGVSRSAFVPLVDAMIEGQSWAPLDASALEPALSAQVPQVVFGDPPPETGGSGA